MLMDDKLESHNVVVGAKQVIGTKVTQWQVGIHYPLWSIMQWNSDNATLCKLLSHFSKEMNTDFV